jgi:hypothetical protein
MLTKTSVLRFCEGLLLTSPITDLPLGGFTHSVYSLDQDKASASGVKAQDVQLREISE